MLSNFCLSVRRKPPDGSRVNVVSVLAWSVSSCLELHLLNSMYDTTLSSSCCQARSIREWDGSTVGVKLMPTKQSFCNLILSSFSGEGMTLASLDSNLSTLDSNLQSTTRGPQRRDVDIETKMQRQGLHRSENLSERCRRPVLAEMCNNKHMLHNL